MRQAPPENIVIFTFIINLYDAYNGDWDTLLLPSGITPKELENFLEYARVFFSMHLCVKVRP